MQANRSAFHPVDRQVTSRRFYITAGRCRIKRYVLLYAPAALSHPGVRAVHDWLVEEAGIFRTLHPLVQRQI